MEIGMPLSVEILGPTWHTKPSTTFTFILDSTAFCFSKQSKMDEV